MKHSGLRVKDQIMTQDAQKWRLALAEAPLHGFLCRNIQADRSNKASRVIDPTEIKKFPMNRTST